MIIKHQLTNEDFYNPNWEIKHLFIGTFNPQGGQRVNYFYGRDSNFTWKILSKIFDENFNPFDDNFTELFFRNIIKHKIACVDIINFVKFDENAIDENEIIGRGYSDSKIINNKVYREYNTESILEIIRNNPNINIYSTWGKGSNLKSWRVEIEKFSNLIKLVSPSKVARVPKGVVKFDYILNDWKNKINR